MSADPSNKPPVNPAVKPPVAPGSDLERQALAALRKMRERLDAAEASEAARNEPLAIVGAACRFPGAPDIDAFWQLLREGRDGIVDIPPERWDEAALAGTRLPRKAGLLPRIDGFDAEFFGITGREAQLMDPQQRLFLEVAWEALERAGMPPLALAGSRTGVFVGTTTSDYLGLLTERLAGAELDAYIVSGNTLNASAGRVSYTLGLHGPAMAIDTACSSSLVAIDRACRSVREGESRLAIAGGVNLVLAPELMVALARWGMLAPDGHCKTFDAAADGFVRAEGCGVVLIKKLSHARADGDRIWALVRGSAVNQAGASGAFAVPNGLAQAEVMRSALAAARVNAAEVGYLEAHGTGTSLGDPIEMEAIAGVYGAGRSAEQALWVGAVKSNVGHLEAAAGVTGLIKTVLALRHRQIPPNLHLHHPSPHIPWASIPVRVPTCLEDFPAGGARRLAAVSAFGFSGTNAHVVLEEAPVADTVPLGSLPALLLSVSARGDGALRQLTERHVARLEALTDVGAAAAYCLAASAARSHLPLRLAVSAPDAPELARRLRAALAPHGAAAAAAPSALGVARGRVGIDRPGVAFFFTGQGAQMLGMGRRLAATSPVFRAALERCAEVIDPLLGRALLPVMFGESGESGQSGEADAKTLLDRTAFTQPALFAIEVALVEWWRSVGVTPALVLGHSVGEFAAAWAAGVLTLEDAALLVTHRGALMQTLPSGGAMAAVFADEGAVSQRIAQFGAGAGALVVAGINGPSETVVSGAASALQALQHVCEKEGVRVERLAVSHAFHSPLMEPMLARFAAVAERIPCKAPVVPVISSMTGAAAGADWGTPDYWQRQLRAPVRWFDAMRTACATPGIGIALEIGPQPVLTGLGRRAWPDAATGWLPSLRRGHDDAAVVMHSLGELYVHGAVDDWSGAAGAAARAQVELPVYPFQHQRHWVDAPATARRRPGNLQPLPEAVHPLLGAPLPLATGDAVFQVDAGGPGHEWLREHRIGGAAIWPATASLEMLLAAALSVQANEIEATEKAAAVELVDIEFHAPLRLPEGDSVAVQTVLARAGADGSCAASICREPGSRESHQSHKSHNGRWPAIATARILAPGLDDRPDRPDRPFPADDAQAAEARCHEPVDAEAFHQHLATLGASFGPAFRRLDDVRRAPGEACGRLLAPPHDEVSAHWVLHPAQLDACLQLVSVAAGAADGVAGHAGEAALTGAASAPLWIPARIDSLRLRLCARHDPPTALRGHARLRAPEAATSGARLVADVQLWQLDGTPLARLEGVHFVRAKAEDIAAPLSAVRLVQRDALEWAWSPIEADERAGASAAPGSHWHLALPAGQGGDPGLAPALAAALRSRGQRVSRGAVAPPEAQHVVQLAGLDGPPFDIQADPAGGALALSADLFETTLSTLRELEPSPDGAAAPRLWVVTRGAQAVAGADRPDPRAAVLWGLARVVRAERPELGCTLIDIDAAQPLAPQAEALVTTLLQAGRRESQLALRAGRLFSACLVPWRRGPALVAANKPSYAQGNPPATGDLQFAAPTSGRIEDLTPTLLTTRPPGPGEVCIEVRAAGLNFRDVLSVLGLVASPVTTLGGECAGRVAAIGAGVSGFTPGDEVMALAIGGLATRVCVPQQFVAQRPAGLSAVRAAALPIACLTASYGLEELAGLKRGERVLIHAATGGVGLAAVLLALALSAEVYATAGSETKRALLHGLGVRHVFDSRDVGFARALRAATGGAGVRVLLNALAGDFIEAGLGLIEPGGCFLEMGKRGVWPAARVAERFPGIRYHVFDLGDAAAAEPTLAPRLFARLAQRLASGALTPLPVTTYPWREARAAFHTMAQARHIGKLVLARDASTPPLPLRLSGDASYLVTGGFGALGLQVAEALVERGARHLVLLGRRSPGPQAEAALSRLAAHGARVRHCLVDVADAQAALPALAALAAEGPALRGIIHCAGALDDGVLAQQDGARLQAVLRPKLGGAINLAQACAGVDLDFFVLFSAGAGWLGNPGQANYAAANAALDALAHTLRAEGWPATAVAWGRWAGNGMAAQHAAWQALGVGEITAAQGLAAMFEFIDHQATSVALLPMDWPTHLRKVHGADAPACFDIVATRRPGDQGGPAEMPRPESTAGETALARLLALPPHRRREALQALLESQVRQTAGLPASQAIDAALPLRDLGLDSLMSVELRNALSVAFGRTLSATLLFDHPTLLSLTDHLMRHLPGLAEASASDLAASALSPSAASSTISRVAAAATVAQLSDDEAEAQLLAELGHGTTR